MVAMPMQLYQQMRKRRTSLFHVPRYARPVMVFIGVVFVLSRVSSPGAAPTPLAPRLRRLPEESAGTRCPAGSRRPLYVFSHLHKTGGNTLKRVLFSFARRNDLSLYHTCHPEIADPALSLTAWWLQRPRKTAQSSKLDCNLDELRVGHLPPANQSRIDLIVGHQPHGVHALFPRRDTRYFTLLRHPLHRKASHFFHFEQPHGASNTSLVEYMLSANSNYVTKRLATRAPLSELALHLRDRAIDVDPFAARAALMSAQTHLLNDFFFVGLHHRYAESVCVLFEILRKACRHGSTHPLPHPAARRNETVAARFVPPLDAARKATENVRGTTGKAVRALPHDLVERILVVEKLDMHLFKLAEHLFEDRLSEYEQCRGVRPSTAAT